MASARVRRARRFTVRVHHMARYLPRVRPKRASDLTDFALRVPLRWNLPELGAQRRHHLAREERHVLEGQLMRQAPDLEDALDDPAAGLLEHLAHPLADGRRAAHHRVEPLLHFLPGGERGDELALRAG